MRSARRFARIAFTGCFGDTAGWHCWSCWLSSGVLPTANGAPPRSATTAEALGDDIISAEARAELSERIESLETIEIDSDNRDADAIRDLMVASAMAENGQLDDAVSRLASISSASDVSKVYRDLAELRSISLRQDRIDAEDLLSELDRMIKSNSEFQLLAKEMMAHAYDRQGDKENAISTLNHLLNEDGLPDELFRRASEFLASLQQGR